MPQNSVAHINCSFVNHESQHVLWSIQLAGSRSISQFAVSKVLLNSRGLFEQSSVSMDRKTTIRLILNSTDENNGSVVQCDEAKSASILFATTITVYGK